MTGKKNKKQVSKETFYFQRDACMSNCYNKK